MHRVLVALTLIGAAPAASQQPDRSTFYVTVGSDTIITERVERTPTRLAFQLVDMRARTRVQLEAQVGSMALLSSVRMSVFQNERDSTPALEVDARFLGDSVGVTRGTTTNWVRVGAGALPNVNPSAALLEQLLMRARALEGDSVSIPFLYLPGGPTVGVTITRLGADSMVVRIATVAIFAAVSPDGQLLGAYIPTQNVRYIRGPATSGPVAGAKDFGPPAGAPYSAQDVAFRTSAGLTLRGTLTLPHGRTGARHPVVVTITGSGTEDRDESIPGLKGYRPYYQLADTLGRRGIGVLRLDDRGGGSDGSPSSPTPELAEDIRAAVSWLRGRADVDPRRIGVVGHSEGGLIAPMVASADSAIAAVVILAGSVSKGREIMEFQQRFVADSMAHLQGQLRERALAASARATDSVARTVPWWSFFLSYDPAPAAARVRAPVLILHGEKDYQVPVVEAGKLAAVIRGGGNGDVTVRTFPATNHLFLPDAGVGFSYEKLPSYVVKPEVLGTIADWLVARLKP
jgi:uncharacterized protein